MTGKGRKAGDMNEKVIQNVRVAVKGEITEPSSVFIANGQIQSIQTYKQQVNTAGYEMIDGKGHLLIPGMIDVHIHGANGFDMMDGKEESIREVSRKCALTGGISFLATYVFSSLDRQLLYNS